MPCQGFFMEILKKNGHLSAQENVTPKPSQNKVKFGVKDFEISKSYFI